MSPTRTVVAVLAVCVVPRLLLGWFGPARACDPQLPTEPARPRLDAPEEGFGIALPPHSRQSSGHWSADWYRFRGELRYLAPCSHEAAVDFYRSHTSEQPYVEHRGSGLPFTTTFDWHDDRGYVTVLLVSERPVVITLIRDPAPAEMVSPSPALVPSGDYTPRQLGIRVPEGARVNSSGYIKGPAKGTAKVEYETLAPFEEVAARYRRLPGARGQDMTSQSCARVIWARANCDFSADIRQTDPLLPTIVRVTCTSASGSEVLLRLAGWHK